MVIVGVVGYGFRGTDQVRVFHESEGSAVVAVCDEDVRRLGDARRRYPVIETHLESGELVTREDIDLVVVATPLNSRFSITRNAINAGKHVLVEAPLAESSAEGEELIARAEGQGVLLAVGHTFLFTPAIRKMKELIDEDEIGRVEYLDSVNLSLEPILENGDVIQDMAAHDLSVVDYLMGRAPERVVVTGSRSAKNGNTNLALINLEFDGGLIAHLHVNRRSPVRVRRMILGGEHRTVIIDDASGNEELRVYHTNARGVLGVDDPQGPSRHYRGDRVGDVTIPYLVSAEPLAVQAQHVLSAITRGTPLRIDGRAGLRVVRLLESCSQSLHDRPAEILLEKSAEADHLLSRGVGEMPLELSISAGAC